MRHKQTPSQTVGPFFAYALTPAQYGYPMTSLVTPELAGDEVDAPRIRIEGRVLDGDGVPISDALVEIVQADEHGHYPGEPGTTPVRNARFTGFGRCGTGTDAHCRYWFDTVKPGATAPGEAPRIDVVVFMRGLLSHVFTRIYFADQAQANAADSVLRAVPEKRRHTLLAQCRADAPPTYVFDIHMQGENETVFFDV